MARPPRDPRLRRDTPGQRPLLQGHLRPGGRPVDNTGAPGETDAQAKGADSRAERPEPVKIEPAAENVEPAAEGVAGPDDVVRGKATRSPDEIATRRHLEGSEQGPT